MFSLKKSRNDTSALLDFLRAVAAQMVCVGHAISFFLPEWWPASLPLPQNVGVLLFFIISGFLITHTLIARSESPVYGFGEFFIERFSRIYSGLLPAAVFVLVVDRMTMAVIGLDPEYAPYPGLRVLASNLLMMQSYRGVFWGNELLPQLPFGSSGPWWTLAIEFHIYLFVGAIFFIGARQRWIPALILVALFFGQTPVHFLAGAFQADGVGSCLFALWLGGASLYFAARWLGPARLPGAVLAVASAVIYLSITHARAEYTPQTYLPLLAFFLGLVMATQATHLVRTPSVEWIARFLADYSYSLYLIHYTILHAIKKLCPEYAIVGMIAGIVLSNILAIVLAEIGEKHHRKLARFLKGRLAGWTAFKPAK